MVLDYKTNNRGQWPLLQGQCFKSLMWEARPAAKVLGMYLKIKTIAASGPSYRGSALNL